MVQTAELEQDGEERQARGPEREELASSGRFKETLIHILFLQNKTIDF